MRTRGELEAGPLGMTEAEVDAYFPGAREALGRPLAVQHTAVLRPPPARFTCDDRDLHVSFEVGSDQYISFTWGTVGEKLPLQWRDSR